MRLTRVLAAAAFAIAAATAAPAAASPPDCEEHPEQCYDCVIAPCYPEDWPPFLLDKVNELLDDEGGASAA